MNTTDLTRSPPTDQERQDIAELLGRILAAYWLNRQRSVANPPAERTEAPGEKPG